MKVTPVTKAIMQARRRGTQHEHLLSQRIRRRGSRNALRQARSKDDTRDSTATKHSPQDT